MIEAINQHRHKLGFLTVEELLESDNTFLDPFSILISCNVTLGKGNTFYPSTVLQTLGQGSVTLGDDNVFTPHCFVHVAGVVRIGDNNLFGDGGLTARVSEGETLTIGNYGRYINGAALTGNNSLGDGSQIIGPIRVQQCVLASGEDFNHPELDERGAVLKGYGLARGVTLQCGQVIDGRGTFAMDDVKMQSFFHPKK
jgi:acetyltransferase-like isoleucine patch superfamily enzyme